LAFCGFTAASPRCGKAASARAVEIGALNYRSIASILANNLDKAVARQSPPEPTLFDHPNIRGPRYFN
jgi:hypothetical protein